MSILSLTRKTLVLVLLVVMAAVAAGCEPVPDRVLTPTEKTADMFWLFSIFDQNYAPRELKEATLGFDYEDLKTQYLDEAVATTNNEDFYAVMNRFVAEFHDAHTSASLVASTLPGRTEVAYLGFNGVRDGDALVVTELLPTTSAGSNFPISVGDRITKLDGVPLRDIVLDEMVKYRNLGYDESNLTYHMNGIFTRTPLVAALPEADDAVVTVDDGNGERDITLPWVVKDLQTFIGEQNEALNANVEATIGGIDAKQFLEAANELVASNDVGAFDVPVAGLPGQTWNYFKFVDNMPTLTSPMVVQKVREHIRAAKGTRASVEDTREYLSSVRNIPSGAIILEESTTFPAYIAKFPTKQPDQPPRFYGYMLLDTFSPASEDLALSEIQDVLSRLEDLGVEHLIIDTIDNGGGSLTFGLKAAQLLSRAPIALPQIQFKTSETWIDQFESQSMSGPSDTEKELARRVYEKLVAARDAGDVISEPMSVDVLMPFEFLDGNSSMPDMKIALLTNEMCVSMCDIFAGVLKDNGLATLIGKRTMGGGGNVVQHAQAPNSHLAVAQTESLILRTDGTPIENVGVSPDVEMEVHESAQSNYDPVRSRAIALLNPCTGPECVPADDLGPAKKSGGCSTTGGQPQGLVLLMLAAGTLLIRRRRVA